MPLPFDFDYVVIALFFCLDAYLIIVNKRTPNPTFIKWNLIFVFFCAISILWSISPHLSFVQVRVRMIANLLMGIFITTYSSNYKNLNTVVLAFYISSFLFLVYIASIVDFSSLNEGRVVGAIEDDDIAEKLNANYIAGRLAFALYAGLFLFWKLQKSGRFAKLFHILFSLAIVYVVLISGSRTSLLVLLIPPIVYTLCKTKHLLAAMAFISVGVVLVYLVLIRVPVFHEIIGSRIGDAVNVVTGNDNGHEDVSRLMLISYGIDWFSDKPIFGYGINCFKVLADRAMLFSTRGKYAHNNYMELMVDVGLIGLILYYSIFPYFIKSVKRLKDVPFTVILKILIVLMLFTDFFWVGYYNRLSQLLVWLTFILISLEKQNLRIITEYKK